MNRCRCGPRHNDSTPPPCSVGFVSTRSPACKPAIRFASFSGEADSGCWLIGRFVGRERRTRISSWADITGTRPNSRYVTPYSTYRLEKGRGPDVERRLRSSDAADHRPLSDGWLPEGPLSPGRTATPNDSTRSSRAANQDSAAVRISGVPICSQSASWTRPHRRLVACARSQRMFSENSPSGASANSRGSRICTPVKTKGAVGASPWRCKRPSSARKKSPGPS